MKFLDFSCQKKFRKYSANTVLTTHIKNAIQSSIKENKPINIVFPRGAYKLWRLEEAPYPDWAELFAALYYTQWLKPICEAYKPGIWLEFFVDDLILPIINNIPSKDIAVYLEKLQELLDFLKSYQPKNLKMTITPFQNFFTSQKDFEDKLHNAVEIFKTTNPTFTEKQRQVVELNAKPTAKQLEDPHWIDKILLIHDAYIVMKREMGYHFQPSKIAIFSQQVAPDKFLAVGTTKTSIVRFWVGVGVLKKEHDTYREYILSPKQLAEAKFVKESIHIQGLDGKNFQSIRVIE